MLAGHRPRNALTLFELVIVLAILAAIAASASIAADRVLSRRRDEVTRQTLNVFQRSVLGRYGQAESVPSVALAAGETALDGFLADMGRLPLAAGSNPRTQLMELWRLPAGVAPFGPKIAVEDSEVVLNCGWRGPYIDLPLGAVGVEAADDKGLTDGWGRSLGVLTRDPDTFAPLAAANGDPIFGVISLGSDGVAGVGSSELPLGEDVGVWLGDPLASPMTSNLVVKVSQRDADGNPIPPIGASAVMVRLFSPNAVGGVGCATQLVPGPFTAIPSFSFEQVPVGPKAIRAYWYEEGSDGSSPTTKSSATPIEVRRGGQASWDLVLPGGSI